jgi:hypothetical protein
MLILDRAAARTSLWPSAAVDCCTSMFIVFSGACPARSVYDARAITPGPVYTTFGIASPSERFLDGYRKGIDVEQQLPALSTYLGHAACVTPIWYLSACPELMEQAARRLDRRWEAKP